MILKEKFELGKISLGFRLEEVRPLSDIHSTGWLFTHEKSGARLFYVENDDENKVFFAAFKTPPENDCGTAHILEHSVLCGSDKYRVKDPFNELAKGSMNTYLNALTYGDKTMYPVGSCNEKDFRNLMDVYLDAVFRPLIYDRPEIFMQEGWHLSLKEADGPLTYNGVVYNEMKGALSNPERLLMDAVDRSLFTESPYRFESGGDPAAIPQLTYESFLDFHRKYYHPSNCYLYLYGDMDVYACMEHIDKEYLSAYEKTEILSDFSAEPKAAAPVLRREYYPVQSAEGAGEYLAYNAICGSCTDPALNYALSVLSSILIWSNASPLKRALMDAGLGVEFFCWADTSSLDNVVSIVAKGAAPGRAQEFEKVVRTTLQKMVDDGIDKDLIDGLVSEIEFYLREEDYGYRPKGLAYGMDLMKRWLHGLTPYASFDREAILEQIARGRTENYYEELIKTYLLDNPHRSLVILSPKEGMEAEAQEKEKQALAALKASMSAEKLEEVCRKTAALKAYQEAPERKEDVDAIPSLKLSDISRQVKYREVRWIDFDKKHCFSRLESNGILYGRALFNCECLTEEEIPYAGLLTVLVGNLATKNYSKEALAVAQSRIYGDIRGFCETYSVAREGKNWIPGLTVDFKFLAEKKNAAFALLREMLLSTDFTAEKEVMEEVRDYASMLEQSLQDNGHTAAARRSLSFAAPAFVWKEAACGVDFLHFLNNLETLPFAETAEKLQSAAAKIFTKENFLCHIGGEEPMTEETAALYEALPSRPMEEGAAEAKADLHIEGLKTAGKVVYCAKSASYRSLGYSYSGTMKVAESVLDRAYLWNRVRVVGGAYGCGVSFLRSGEVYFYSYRDPSVGKTFAAFDEAADFLANLELSEEERTKYILGAVNKATKPKANGDKADIYMRDFIAGHTKEKRQENMNRMLDTTTEDLRALAPLLRTCMAQNNGCVLGSAEVIEKEQELFDKTGNLL